MGKHDWNWKPPGKSPVRVVSARPSALSPARVAAIAEDFESETRREAWEIREAMGDRFPRQCPMCQEFMTEAVPGDARRCRCRRAGCGAVWWVWRGVENLP